jgi:DNA-binding Lrp family transcriptional regulator
MSKRNEDKKEQEQKKVLSELIRNSDEHIEIIAQHCGFSRQKVWAIIKELEAKKLIWGYTAIFDELKQGVHHFVMMMKRTNISIDENTLQTIVSRKIEQIAADLGIAIESSLYLHGEYDWIVTFTAKDIVQAKKFSEAWVTLHPRIIENVTIMQTLMFIKKQYILNPEREKIKDIV